MEPPLEIVFRGMDPSPAVETKIREKATWLKQFHERIVSCKVTVDRPHRHKHHGGIYHVKVEVGIPGRPTLVVSREPELDHAREDVYVSIGHAFDVARRRLQDVTSRMAGSGRHHG